MASVTTEDMRGYFGNALFQHPAGFLASTTFIWVGLATTAFTVNGSGVEMTGSGYARHKMKRSSVSWTVAAAAGVWTATNVNAIHFPIATSAYASNIVGWGIFLAATGGDYLFYGPTASKAVAIYETPVIDVGGIVIEAQ